MNDRHTVECKKNKWRKVSGEIKVLVDEKRVSKKWLKFTQKFVDSDLMYENKTLVYKERKRGRK